MNRALMKRIKKKFDELSSNDSKALITYIVAGDPDLDTTFNIMNCMVEEGADIIEIGIPFSDPMAEGISIQKGHERALLNKTSIKDALNLVSKFRRSNESTPIVFMGYMNTFESMGVKEICDLSSGYIYYISVKGITGSNDLDSEDVKQKVNLLGSATDLPIAIGFGIKDSDSALSVKDLADGIVAGSVFVDLIGEGGDTITKIANNKGIFI